MCDLLHDQMNYTSQLPILSFFFFFFSNYPNNFVPFRYLEANIIHDKALLNCIVLLFFYICELSTYISVDIDLSKWRLRILLMSFTAVSLHTDVTLSSQFKNTNQSIHTSYVHIEMDTDVKKNSF